MWTRSSRPSTSGTRRAKRFTILAVAEGAISKEDAALSKKEYKAKQKKNTYPSISYELADQIFQKTGKEIRITVPGHTQRGGSPCPYDRVLSTRLGAAAANLILNKQYGNMVGLVNGEIVPVPLEEMAGKAQDRSARQLHHQRGQEHRHQLRRLSPQPAGKQIPAPGQRFKNAAPGRVCLPPGRPGPSLLGGQILILVVLFGLGPVLFPAPVDEHRQQNHRRRHHARHQAEHRQADRRRSGR